MPDALANVLVAPPSQKLTQLHPKFSVPPTLVDRSGELEARFKNYGKKLPLVLTRGRSRTSDLRKKNKDIARRTRHPPTKRNPQESTRRGQQFPLRSEVLGVIRHRESWDAIGSLGSFPTFIHSPQCRPRPWPSHLLLPNNVDQRKFYLMRQFDI